MSESLWDCLLHLSTAVTLLWPLSSTIHLCDNMPVKAKKLFPKCSACSALSPTLLLAAQWHLEAAQTCSNGRVAIRERTSSVSSLLDHDSNRDIPWSFLYCKSIICWNLAPSGTIWHPFAILCMTIWTGAIVTGYLFEKLFQVNESWWSTYSNC